jgi:cytoskeleton protein RodZ
MYDGLRDGVFFMITVGETLRRERLKRNLDLDQVSRELKISVRFLEAIEDEDFEKLPGGVFAKAFVRQYGRLLGLNDEELAAQVQQTLEPPPAETADERRFANVAPIQVPRMEEWQRVGDRGFRWSGSLSAAIVVVLVMLLCSGIYTWLQRPRSPVSARNTVSSSALPSAAPATQPAAPAQPEPPQSSPAQTAPQQPTPPPVKPATSEAPAASPGTAATADASSTPAQPVTPAAKPEADSTKPEADSPAPPPNPDATIHVAITADEPVWVQVRSDGKVAFSGTIDAQKSRTVDAVDNVTLRIGNAGGATITFNGKTIGPVGPKGQVRTIQFTSGGFQIVPAAKPPSDGVPPVDRL